MKELLQEDVEPVEIRRDARYWLGIGGAIGCLHLAAWIVLVGTLPRSMLTSEALRSALWLSAATITTLAHLAMVHYRGNGRRLVADRSELRFMDGNRTIWCSSWQELRVETSGGPLDQIVVVDAKGNQRNLTDWLNATAAHQIKQKLMSRADGNPRHLPQGLILRIFGPVAIVTFAVMTTIPVGVTTAEGEMDWPYALMKALLAFVFAVSSLIVCCVLVTYLPERDQGSA